jgi:hypothetical protein
MSHFGAGPEAEEQLDSKIPYHNLLLKLAPLLDLLLSIEAHSKGNVKKPRYPRNNKNVPHAKNPTVETNEKNVILTTFAPGHVKHTGDNYTIERNEKEKNNKQKEE